MVGPDNGAINHLDTVGHRAALIEGVQQNLPNPGQCPAPELPIDRLPLAEMIVQVTPLRAIQKTPSRINR